jgi:hypothetical protein
MKSSLSQVTTSQKEIILSLMKVSNSDTTLKRKGTEVKAIEYQCPRPNCRKKIKVAVKEGFTNPFAHLKSCYGGETVLRKHYKDAVEGSGQQSSATSSIGGYLKASNATEVHKSLHGWIDLVVSQMLPISYVEDIQFRNFSKFSHNFSNERVKQVILELVKIVEKKLELEMKGAGCGAIMHDGWTLSGVHYVGLFASYNRKIKVFKNGKGSIEHETTISLIACAPMAAISETNDSDDEEPTNDAANFNAKVHAQYFIKMFQYYNLNVKQWAKCSTADNTTTNVKTAKELGIPHVGCNSHKLNLDMNDWMEAPALKNIIESVADTMKEAKNSLKNASLLRRLTSLKPVLFNKTRWSGKFNMLSRFVRVRVQLVTVAEDENSNLTVRADIMFYRKTVRVTLVLEKFNEVTIFMQTRLITLSMCRRSLDHLIDRATAGRTREGNVFYRNGFIPKRTQPRGTLTPYPDFESGVVKIQRGESGAMNDAEKLATHLNTSIVTSSWDQWQRLKGYGLQQSIFSLKKEEE